MKVKTAEAKDGVLDWLVARCEEVAGLHVYLRKPCIAEGQWSTEVNYSTNPAQAYPIIYREGILNGPSPFPTGEFAACIGSDWDTGRFIQVGPTPLVAALRCYVSSKLGDEVEVPDELLAT